MKVKAKDLVEGQSIRVNIDGRYVWEPVALVQALPSGLVRIGLDCHLQFGAEPDQLLEVEES